MIYAMSDIHGRWNEYKKMRKLISFNPLKDKMYILGDFIDRGPRSVELIRYFMKKDSFSDNVLMGNHEKELIDYIDYYGWNYNDGIINSYTARTYNDIKASFSREECVYVYCWLKGLPLQIKREIQGKYFWFVHGQPKQHYVNEKDLLFSDHNFFIDYYSKAPVDGYITIVGHLPVNHLTFQYGYKYTEGKIWHNRASEGNVFSLYDIDCGAAYPEESDSKMGCLCLDSMSEYYVELTR